MALPGMALPPSPYRVSTLVSVTPAVSPSVCLCVSQPSVPLSLVAPRLSLFWAGTAVSSGECHQRDPLGPWPRAPVSLATP